MPRDFVEFLSLADLESIRRIGVSYILLEEDRAFANVTLGLVVLTWLLLATSIKWPKSAVVAVALASASFGVLFGGAYLWWLEVPSFIESPPHGFPPAVLPVSEAVFEIAMRVEASIVAVWLGLGVLVCALTLALTVVRFVMVARLGKSS